VKWFEVAAPSAFGARLVNWTCLMNNAYQNDPPDPQVHWHATPRYSKVVEFAGKTWIDELFGHHYRSGKVYKRLVDEKTFSAIRDELRKHAH